MPARALAMRRAILEVWVRPIIAIGLGEGFRR
jgi:hypothetical protein